MDYQPETPRQTTLDAEYRELRLALAHHQRYCEACTPALPCASARTLQEAVHSARLLRDYQREKGT